MSKRFDFKNQLDYCFKKIAFKLNWPGHNLWRHSEFVELSRLITEKTKISVSASTLKRLSGKTINFSEPSWAILNALAKFIDYHDWEDFIQNGVPTNIKQQVIKEQKKQLLKPIIIIFTLIVFSLILYFFFKQKKINPNLIQYKCNNPIKEAPAIYEITYNLKDFKNNKIIIENFGIGNPKPFSKILTKEDIESGKTTIYQPLPGVRNIVLTIDKHRVDSIKAYAYTIGWQGFMQKRDKKNYPTIFKIHELKNDSVLRFPSYIISDIGINSLDQYSFYFFNVSSDFKYIDGDNFSMETRFRNRTFNPNNGSRKTKTGMIFENGFLDFYFVMPGFTPYLNIYYSEKEYNGKFKDLSGFETNLNEWQKVLCKIENKHMKVWLNDSLIYQDSYVKNLGKMAGFNFSGYMEVDYVKLYDSDGVLFYEENFTK